MKSFLISDNHDTLLGMRLAGVEGIVVHKQEEVVAKFNEVAINQDIGIIIVTEKIMDLARDEIMSYKVRESRPLIVEIPDRHGSIRGGEVITNYIRESVGIHI